MKRLSDHCNFLNNDIDNIGAFAVVHNIENLNEVVDGLYSVVMCNVRKDWGKRIYRGLRLQASPISRLKGLTMAKFELEVKREMDTHV